MEAGDLFSFFVQNLFIIFPVLFVIIWVIVGKVISIASGWKALAEKYPVRTPFSGERHKFQSARMRRGMNFNNCLTIGANHMGLYLSVFVLFRIGHEPIFIPWSEISASVEKGRFANYIKLSFLRSPENWIKISQKLYQRLERDSGVTLRMETP
jgi:hypothetical protein